MKHSFKCLLGLLLAAQSLQAQTDDSTAMGPPEVVPTVQLPTRDTVFTIRRKTLGVSLYSESGSPGMPLAITGRFLLGGYIPAERIAETEERLKPNVRGGLAYTMKLNVADKFYVRRHQMGGIRFNDDAFRLVFQGNGAYMGQTLDARIRKAAQWDIVELGFGFEKSRRLKGGKGNVIIGGTLNPGWLRSYSAVNDFRAQVYTDTLAQNVDVMWGGNVQRATGGFGLTVNAVLMYDFIKGPWQLISLNVDNAGLYYTGGLTTYSRLPGMAASTVRLEAATTSLNKIFRGDWFGDRVDTVKQQLGLDSSRSSKTLFAPFEVSVGALHKHLGWLSLSYRNLPGYVPRLDWQPNTRLGVGNLRFYPCVSLGGFDTWNIGLLSSLSWRAMQRGGLFANLRLEGLESLVLPGRLNGFGAYASVRMML
jgi:hypothetical protein